MRRAATVLLLAVLFLAVWGCTPGANAATPRLEADSAAVPAGLPRMALWASAAGDSVFPRFYYRVTNRPDSVACVFSGGGSPTFRVVVPGSAGLCGPGILVPNPVVAEGDSIQLAVNWTLYKRGTPNVAGGPYLAWWKRPVLPPSLSGDSLVAFQLWPDTVTAVAGDTVRFMTVARYANGVVTTWMRDYWTAGEAGVQVVWAGLDGLADTSRIRVLVSAREPAGFTPFARFDGSRIPPFPRAKLAGTGCGMLCGRWL